MPGPLDQISWVVIGYAVLVLGVAGYAAWRWRARPPWLASMCWMLEVLAGIRALAGLGALSGDDRPDSMSTHIGYLLVSVLAIPLALSSVRDDEGPWSIGVIAVAVAAVGVVSVRVMTTQ